MNPWSRGLWHVIIWAVPQLDSLPSPSVGARKDPGSDDGAPPEGELDDTVASLLANASPYPARPVRPLTRLALRLGLWGAVVLGALGGVVGLLFSGGGGSSDPEVVPSTQGVPAPVGGMAELVVEEWVLATTEDPARVEALFVESPALPSADDTGGREVLGARAVAGEQVDDGYWAVTVAVDLVDGIGLEEASTGGADGEADDEAGGDGDDAEEAEPDSVTWYVEVGIVGEEDGALAALRTPAIVPPVAEVAEGWSSRAEEVLEPRVEDLETTTLEDFLRTILVGEGDPTRYVATGVEIAPVDPPPFVDLEITSLTVEERSETVIRAQVYVDATTAAGASQFAAYEVVAEWRGDRLEVLELWGAASLAGRPTDPAEGDDG